MFESSESINLVLVWVEVRVKDVVLLQEVVDDCRISVGVGMGQPEIHLPQTFFTVYSFANITYKFNYHKEYIITNSLICPRNHYLYVLQTNFILYVHNHWIRNKNVPGQSCCWGGRWRRWGGRRGRLTPPAGSAAAACSAGARSAGCCLLNIDIKIHGIRRDVGLICRCVAYYRVPIT